MNIKMMRIDSITPYKKNAKKHPDEQVEHIANSIREFGWQQPLVVDKDNVLVIGHGRLLAAKRLGLKEVPVVMADQLSEQQIAALRLADNKTNESEWDFGLLELELEDISDIDMEQFGFVLEEDEEPTEIIDDEIPEDVETRSKVGDLWQLGKHRLICGDSTDIPTIERLMGGVKADMVFTDPPWNVNYGATSHPSWKQRTIKNDSMSTDDFKEFMFKTFKVMNNASKAGCMTYVVMSAQEWGNMMLTLAQNDYHWSSTIIWNKDRLVLSRKDYHTKYEPIWYGWKEGASRLCPLEDRKQSDVWDFERPSRSDEHPTMKPVPLVAKAITNSSKKENAVLDLFGGSGTTLIACEQLNRTCYMSELDPHYCDVILQRWENFTGEKAVLL